MPLSGITYDKFAAFASKLSIARDKNLPFLYQCLLSSCEAAQNMNEKTGALGSAIINPLLLSLYLINEHDFYLKIHQDKKEEQLIEDENYQTFLISLSLDKYLTIEHIAPKEKTFSSWFRPDISTLNLYCSFLLGMLSHYKQGEPSQTLLVDILNKAFSMARCILYLLTSGFETEAFSTWRTLHENECILEILLKGGKEATSAYLKHMRYALAFRGQIASKEETDAIFEQLKKEMREHDLKSKDMKRYIEYGWMMDLSFVKNDPSFKLNFRDGVERVAGLSSYRKEYETSSEIAHSSPLLLYSRKSYFYYKTLINLYESFFRLEKAFSFLYLPSISEEEKTRYLNMQKLYFGELRSCYQYICFVFHDLKRRDLKENNKNI